MTVGAVDELLNEDERPGEFTTEADRFVGRVAEVFDALGHPLRLRILHLMALGVQMSPKDITAALAEVMEEPPRLGTVAYHVREMASAELIHQTASGRVRGAAQHFYRPTDKGLLVIERIKGLHA